MPDDEIAREAWRREASHHEGHRNFRPHLRKRGSNLMGLRGEEAFVKMFGGEVDLTPRLGGDGGKDQWIEIDGKPIRIDCKAAIIPKDLIVEVGACRPDTIYVLCRYIEAEDCCDPPLGWAWGHELMKSEPKDYGYGVINYWRPRHTLHRMSELRELIDCKAEPSPLPTKAAWRGTPGRGKACPICKKTNGYFERATYDGAPEDGVAVHGACLSAFWEKLERDEWNRIRDAHWQQQRT